jgi:hypothetical protein
MGTAAKTLFGGVDRSGQKETAKQNAFSRQYTHDLYDTGRRDLQASQANIARMLAGGYGGALNVMRSAIPQQLNTVRDSNFAAQQAVLAGLQGSRAALLGGRPNYASLQPTRLGVNTQFVDNAILPGGQ